MNLDLMKKVVLVSGASRGLGKYIAQAFVDEDATVVINSREQVQLEKTAADINCAGYEIADVIDVRQCEMLISRIIEKHGRLDILICNVGSSTSVPDGEESENEWRRMLDVNLLSAINLLTAAKEALITSKGVIVCVSSICGSNVIKNAPIAYYEE